MAKTLISASELEQLAKLANIDVPAEFDSRLMAELSSVLNFVSQLQKIDITNIDSTAEVTGLTNVTQKDLTAECLSQEDVLKSAARTNDGYIVVKGVFAEEDA